MPGMAWMARMARAAIRPQAQHRRNHRHRPSLPQNSVDERRSLHSGGLTDVPETGQTTTSETSAPRDDSDAGWDMDPMDTTGSILDRQSGLQLDIGIGSDSRPAMATMTVDASLDRLSSATRNSGASAIGRAAAPSAVPTSAAGTAAAALASEQPALVQAPATVPAVIPLQIPRANARDVRPRGLQNERNFYAPQPFVAAMILRAMYVTSRTMVIAPPSTIASSAS